MSPSTRDALRRLPPGRRSYPVVTPADAATHRGEEARWRVDLLALDPLSPIVGRPITDTPSQPELLALDPLGPIPRFSRGS